MTYIQQVAQSGLNLDLAESQAFVDLLCLSASLTRTQARTHTHTHSWDASARSWVQVPVEVIVRLGKIEMHRCARTRPCFYKSISKSTNPQAQLLLSF